MTRGGRFEFADRIRAVLFDAGNTLLWLDHARMAEIVTGAGVATDTATLRLAEMRARPLLDPYLRTAARREGRGTSRRHASLLLSNLGADPATGSGAAAVEALMAVWGALWCRPPADASTTIEVLAGRGLLLGCVSNAAGNVRELLDEAGLAARLACVVDSGIEGVEKPDPRIFLRGAERVGAEPAECVYVGDLLSLDVEGARGAGMESVLLDPAGAWGERGVPSVASLAEFAARL